MSKKNVTNTYHLAHRYGTGKGWRDRHKSQEYLNNFDAIFGPRCDRHRTEKLPCKRCEENEMADV